MEWNVLKPPELSGASEQTRRILEAKMFEAKPGFFDLDIVAPDVRLTLAEQKATRRWPQSRVLAVKEAMAKHITLDRMEANFRSRGRGWSRRTLADIRAALSEAAGPAKTSKK